MKPTHLFFDLDGTLTNPREGICACIAHALSQLGSPIPTHEELQQFIGDPLEQIFSVLLNTDDPLRLRQAVDLYRERFSTVGLFENEVYDGIPEVLHTLTKLQGYSLYLVTAKPTVFARQILQHFDLFRFLKNVYGSELDGSRVHKQDIIAHALENASLQPEQALMIGDRDLDIQGAQQHGLSSMAVTWGFGSLTELTPAHPDLWAHSPADIPHALSGYSVP